MVEQRIENSCVTGSSPVVATICPGRQIGKVVSLKRRNFNVGSNPTRGTMLQTKVLNFIGCTIKASLLQ